MKKLIYNPRGPLATLVLILMITALTLTLGPTLSEAEELSTETRYHTVVKGDTLWDISETYFFDPFAWPGLWKRNPQVRNPHLIYPGDTLKITKNGIEVVSRVEAEVYVEAEYPEDEFVIDEFPEEEAEYIGDLEEGMIDEAELFAIEEEIISDELPPVTTLTSTIMAREGLITKRRIKTIGVIVRGMDEDKTMLHHDDIVYLSLKRPDDTYAGDQLTIAMEREKVYHPKTGRYLGRFIDILGHLEVISTEGTVQGRIDVSYKEIHAGAMLVPYQSPVTSIELDSAYEEVNGVIIKGEEEQTQMAEHYIVYIDKGQRDGVASGNILEVFRENEPLEDPLRKGKLLTISPTHLGEIVIIKAYKTSSSAIVVSAERNIIIGDLVRTVPAMIID